MPPCSTDCWLLPLKFYLLQYFMQYVLWVFVIPGFSGFMFTWRFSFVSIWKRLKENVSSHEWIWCPFCVNTRSSPDYRSMPVCCVWHVAGGIYRVLEWFNCTKNPVLHWMLFNCCFSQSLMQVHQAVILCFVLFFNYLRSPSSRLVLFQLSCSLMPIKTNLTVFVSYCIFFCGRAKHHGKRL